MEVLPVWILGVAINVFLFYSMVQINYISPFLPISKTHETNMSTGVKRVIIFIADGLRADTFFENPHSRPRLEAVMRSGFSASGISVSRSPTMSKPGFSAMFAGVYLDTTTELRSIWTRNPNEFDTVFNRTSFTLLLGCIDIPLQDFAQGVGREKIHAEIFPKPEKKNDTTADIWVRDKFRTIMNLKMVPSQDKVLIVLHFLCTDYNGHLLNYKNLLNCLAFLDEIVSEVEARLGNYFEDNNSMFIFTSDHGMRNDSDDHHGRHGLGTRVEVETPFVIWGKGIQSRVAGLTIAQVDMAPFLASALNIPFPVHSMGLVPTDVWQDKAFAYDALQANFRQFYERMSARRNVVDLGGVMFRPFPQEDHIRRLMKRSSEISEKHDYDNAIAMLKAATRLTLKGLRYYETSSIEILALLTAYTFILWIAIIAFSILNFERKTKFEFFFGAKIVAEILLAVFAIRGLLGWSLWRTGYIFFPIHLTQLFCSALRWERTSMEPKCLRNLSLTFLFGVGILITLLYNRQVMTISLILLGFWTIQGKIMSTRDKLVWATSLTLLGIFPMLPVVGKSKSPEFVTLGPLVCGFIALWSLKQFSAAKFALEATRRRDRRILYFQTCLVFSVCVLIHFPDLVLTRFVAWSSLALACTAPFFVTASSVFLRLLSVFLAIAAPMSFLSFTYDSLFLPALFVALFILLKMENTDKSCSPDHFWSLSYSISSGSAQLEIIHAFRQTWLLICFSFLCFFGTGSVEHIAALEDYEGIANCFMSPLKEQQRAVPAVVRIVGPLLIVATFFRFLLKSRREADLRYLIILLISQSVAFFTFFSLRNNGDPKEIGISVAYYIIPQTMTFGLAIFQWLASTLVGARTL